MLITVDGEAMWNRNAAITHHKITMLIATLQRGMLSEQYDGCIMET